jgi:predicted TIM-barrel fold metal-dependent hydrolase
MRADLEARRHGMSRREFLTSSMGVAVTLTGIHEMGCDGNLGAAAPPPPYDSGKPYVLPPHATCDPDAYVASCNDFILDMQTYCFDAGPWRTTNWLDVTFFDLVASCTDVGDKLDCLDPQHYAELLFLDSDTTMTVLSSWPASTCYPERSLFGNPPVNCGLPLTNQGTRVVRDWINAKAQSQRCINAFQVMPNDFLERQVEAMHAAVEDPAWQCCAWKVTPAWTSDTYPSPQGYAQAFYLTDPIGLAFIEAGLKLGVPNFAVHKGLPFPGFDLVRNQPWDIGPVARMFPQANFIIQCSAINAGIACPPDCGDLMTPCIECVQYPGYDPANTPADPTVIPLAGPSLTGVNQLIQSLIGSGVIADPDKGEPFRAHNVYAGMGSAWSQVMKNTNASQHYIGKLLKYLGADNVCWATDCILGGSPQSQITAFQAFQITPQFQEMYGYPAITPTMKAQIFGLNAARIFHVDPNAARCTVNRDTFALARRARSERLAGTGRERAGRSG